MSDIDELFEELKQKRDELRVQINLAEKMDDFAERAQLRETGEGVAQALGQVGSELKTGYDRIRDALKESD